MSTERGIIRPAHPAGRQVWVAIVALLLMTAVTIAVVISATRLDPRLTGFVPSQPEHAGATSVPGEGYRGPHRPHHTPKQMPARDHYVGPHGPNRTPKG
jgi:hypothetical protein